MTDDERLEVATRAAEAGAFAEIYGRAYELANNSLRGSLEDTSALTLAFILAVASEAEAIVGEEVPALRVPWSNARQDLPDDAFRFWAAVARSWLDRR